MQLAENVTWAEADPEKALEPWSMIMDMEVEEYAKTAYILSFMILILLVPPRHLQARAISNYKIKIKTRDSPKNLRSASHPTNAHHHRPRVIP